MEHITFSVIIPIYKAEATLARCLDSLLNQPHEDVEFLLINDGSPDDCGHICEDYAAQHSCVRYFQKANGGVSSARNLGLENAAGIYVLFVDSDDYVTPDYFSVLREKLLSVETDMLMFGYQNFGGNAHSWNTGEFQTQNELETAVRASAVIRAYLFCTLINKTFRRSIICDQHLRFREDLAIGEDQTFILEYALHCKTMVSIADILYRVSLENQDSLSRKQRDYLAEQLICSYRAMLSAVKSSDLERTSKEIYRRALVWMFYRSAYSACKELLKYDLCGKERRRRIRLVCKQFVDEEVLPCGLKCWIIALPIKLHLTAIIDYLIGKAQKRRASE